MKDIVSTLQSRIAKRARFMNKEYVHIQYSDGSTDFKTMAQEPHHFDSIYHTAQQKTDKRALAEIIRLRRELKEREKIVGLLSKPLLLELLGAKEEA